MLAGVSSTRSKVFFSSARFICVSISCTLFGDLIEFHQCCLKLEVADGGAQGIEVRLLYNPRYHRLQNAKRLFSAAVTGLEQGPKPCDRAGCHFSIERRGFCYLRLSGC